MRKERKILSDGVVYDISKRVALGEKQVDLAREFNVTQSTISHILSGKNRKGQKLVGAVRECAKCGSPFTVRNGKQIYCKAKQCDLAIKRDRNDAWYAKGRKPTSTQVFLAAKDKPCMDCGGYWPDKPWRMEFDHRDPNAKLQKLKGTNIKRTRSMRSLFGDELLAEIAKCDVVCRLCHSDRTAASHRAGKINTVPFKKARSRRPRAWSTQQGALFAAIASQ
jgi:hypothetical protein